MNDGRMFLWGFIFLIGDLIFIFFELKHQKAMEEFYEQKKDLNGKEYYIIKKRSSSLPIKVKKFEYLIYEYKQDTPHYRTMIVGNAATTQYVDNSGLKPVQTIDSGRGYLYINDDLIYPCLTFSKELMKEFKEKYPNSYKYQTQTSFIKNAEYLLLCENISPLRVNGRVPDGYSKYYEEYYAENSSIALDYELFDIAELKNLVAWLKSDAS